MADLEKIVREPIFFERNRVFRVYKGGKLFGDFFGDEPVDGNLPEEWIASAVKALNKDSKDEHEGISKIKDCDIYFDELIEKYRDEVLGGRKDLGVLVKGLDSAIRLPIQAHPDRAFSRKYFNSEYGKAESWYVLATRPGAKLYFGFKNKITREEFADAVKRSDDDKNAMEPLISGYDVKKGDVFFVPAKMVHAIGYGCLMLEVQEPTDFTVQPERWCGDYRLSDHEMYLTLDKDIALDCFNYDVYGEEALKLGKKKPKKFVDTPTVCSEVLIGKDDTDCFGVDRHRINGGDKTLDNMAIYVVTEGKGKITGENYEKDIKKGDYFFLPFAAKGKFSISADNIEIVECRSGN